MDAFGLGDHCIVPWKDGSMYAGRVQKIFDPQREIVVQTVSVKKGGKVVQQRESTPLAKFRADRHTRTLAKAISGIHASSEPWFYVHYAGWKPTHDEWIPEERMLPYTPKHIAEMNRVNGELKERARAARLAEKAKKAKPTKTKPKRPKPELDDDDADSRSSSPAASKPLKRGRQASPFVETSLPLSSTSKRRRIVDDSLGPEIRVSVPLDLKRILVRDWELVTHSRRIVQLPRPVSVVAILRAFVDSQVDSRDPRSSGRAENLEQFATSITTYFDYALGMLLLYRFERNQYYTQRQHSPIAFRPSLVYGAEHLARLIVTMPSLLAQMAQMDDKTTEFVIETVDLLAKFMTDRKTEFFAGEQTYDSATRVYEAFSVPDMQGDAAPETETEAADDSPEPEPETAEA